jgi:hypothetical protein
MRRNKSFPDEQCIAQGTKLLCRIHTGASGHAGEVSDEQGNIRWRYATRKNSSGRSLRNPLKKPDFVLVGPDSDENIIRRTSFAPSIFTIIEASRTIGTIEMLSLFLNRYAIRIDGQNPWIFRMPLFTILFFGESTDGVAFWVRVGPSERHWNILLQPGIAEWPLVAALAFIHSERYFHS